MRWLRDRRPDVVGLQELKMRDDQFPSAEFEAAGYSAITHGQKAWNGVAILSRQPAVVRQVGLPGQEDFGARLLTAEVCGITFTTVYVPNGKALEHADYERKLEWLDALLEHFRRLHDPLAPGVLCGDFNIVPAALDTWNEERLGGTIFHSEPERQRFAYFLQWGGLSDLFRRLHPAERVFSWWDYRALSFPRNQGMRIDFLLGTQRIAERLEYACIDRDYRKKLDGLTASDHAPVIADLN